MSFLGFGAAFGMSEFICLHIKLWFLILVLIGAFIPMNFCELRIQKFDRILGSGSQSHIWLLANGFDDPESYGGDADSYNDDDGDDDDNRNVCDDGGDDDYDTKQISIIPIDGEEKFDADFDIELKQTSCLLSKEKIQRY